MPAEYYVNSSTGDDSNDGSIGSPWQTFVHAMSQMSETSGGKILWMVGTHTLTSNFVFSSGDHASTSYSDGNPLAIMAYPSAVIDLDAYTMTIDVENVMFLNIQFENGTGDEPLHSTKPNNSFYSCRFVDSSGDGVSCHDFNTVIGCEAVGFARYGIHVEDYNHCSENYVDARTGTYGIYGLGQRINIIRNRVYLEGGRTGIYCSGGDGSNIHNNCIVGNNATDQVGVALADFYGRHSVCNNVLDYCKVGIDVAPAETRTDKIKIVAGNMFANTDTNLDHLSNHVIFETNSANSETVISRKDADPSDPMYWTPKSGALSMEAYFNPADQKGAVPGLPYEDRPFQCLYAGEG